jgi:cytochrome c oxidase subunit 4
MMHVSSTSLRYLLVWVALVALTGLSFLMSRLHLGTADVVIALGIATVKTVLVLLFFMHLVEARFSIVLIPVAAIFFILLLAGLVATDVATRMTFPVAPAPYVGLPEAE